MFIVVAFIVIYRSIKLLKVLPGLAILVITGGLSLLGVQLQYLLQYILL